MRAMHDSSSSSSTRPSLLVRVRDAQDHEAWNLFVATYAPVIYRYCRRKGLQDADAADVTQDVLAQVARSMRTFTYQPERGRFRDWLCAVTRSKLPRSRPNKDRAGGDDRVDGLLEQIACSESDSEWTAEFNGQVLRFALDRIRPHFEPTTWWSFERCWLDNRPAADVARELGLPIDAVYVAKSRVLKRLREEVLALAEDFPQYVPLS
jgi:RNA polymerase sigma factor (sigma-70 family)